MTFEIFKGINGQFYFRIKAANGEKVAQSEGYTQKQSALNTVNLIKREAGSAQVIDLT